MSECSIAKLSRSPDNASALIAGVVLSVIGPGTFLVLPALVGAVSRDYAFSERQIGVLSSALSGGGLLSALLAGLWVRTASWTRVTLVASTGLILCNALCLVTHGFYAFTVFQGLVGLFGGSVASLAMTVLSDSRDHDRNFGFAIAAQVVFQVIGVLAGPALVHLGGTAALLLALSITGGLGLLMAPLLPHNRRAASHGSFAQAVLERANMCALLGCFCFFVNVGCFWTYIELIGSHSGLTPTQIARGLAVAVAAGVPGALLASLLGNRAGRIGPLTVAGLLTAASALMLFGTPSFAMFVAASLIYNFAWNYALPYQFGVVNAADATGRSVAVAPAFYSAGSTAGPAIVALFFSPNDHGAVLYLVIGSVAASTVFFCASVSASRRRAETGASPSVTNGG